MDFKTLANHLRKPTASLAVRDIRIVTDQEDFTGDGKITIDKNRIELQVIVNGEREIRLAGGRSFSRDEFWKIGGVIEGQIPFWAVSLPHASKSQSNLFATVRSAEFGLDVIHHLTSPFGDGGMRAACSTPTATKADRFNRMMAFAPSRDLQTISSHGVTRIRKQSKQTSSSGQKLVV